MPDTSTARRTIAHAREALARALANKNPDGEAAKAMRSADGALAASELVIRQLAENVNTARQTAVNLENYAADLEGQLAELRRQLAAKGIDLVEPQAPEAPDFTAGPTASEIQLEQDAARTLGPEPQGDGDPGQPANAPGDPLPSAGVSSS